MRRSLDNQWLVLSRLAGEDLTLVNPLNNDERERIYHIKVAQGSNRRLVRQHQGNKIRWKVRMFLAGQQRDLAIYDAEIGTMGTEIAPATLARVSDAALLYFWKYRRNWRDTPTDDDFNLSRERAQADLKDEPDLSEALASLEKHLVKQDLLPDENELERQHQRNDPHPRATANCKLAARITVLERELENQKKMYRDLQVQVLETRAGQNNKLQLRVDDLERQFESLKQTLSITAPPPVWVPVPSPLPTLVPPVNPYIVTCEQKEVASTGGDKVESLT